MKKIVISLFFLILSIYILPDVKMSANVITDGEKSGFVIVKSDTGYMLIDYVGNASSITVPKGVTEIGYYAFAESDISKVKLPNTVKTIHIGAFANCYKLKSIELSSKLNRIEMAAFINCKSLKLLLMPDSVTYLGAQAFSNCTSLKKVTISTGLNKLKEHTFDGCSSMEEIYIPKSVKNIYPFCFNNCTKLENVDFGNGIRIVQESAFRNCKSLNVISFPKTLKRLESYVFRGCKNLSIVDLNGQLDFIGKDIFEGVTGSPITVWFKNDEYEVYDGYMDGFMFRTGCGKALEEFDYSFVKKVNDCLYNEIGIAKNDTDYTKIKKVHDWMVFKVSYSKKLFDKQYWANRQPEEIAFTDRISTCMGYARLFRLFMDLCDIPCLYITNSTHAWNMVLMDDGCWYHVDTTWDDPGGDHDKWVKGYYSDENLLRNDAGIIETGHKDWDSSAPKATGTYYEYYTTHDTYYKVS